MTNLIALYRGDSLSSIKMVALSSDENLVSDFTKRMLRENDPSGDPVLDAIQDGQRKALETIQQREHR